MGFIIHHHGYDSPTHVDSNNIVKPESVDSRITPMDIARLAFPDIKEADYFEKELDNASMNANITTPEQYAVNAYVMNSWPMNRYLLASMSEKEQLKNDPSYSWIKDLTYEYDEEPEMTANADYLMHKLGIKPKTIHKTGRIQTIEQVASYMHSFINKCIIPDDMYAWRSALLGDEKDELRAVYKHASQNGVYCKKAFTSVSTKQFIPTNNPYFVIKLPKGSKAGYLSPSLGGYSGEYEIVIDQFSKFKIKGIYERSERINESFDYTGLPPIIALELIVNGTGAGSHQ